MPQFVIRDVWIDDDDWLIMLEGTEYWIKVRNECKKKLLPRSYKSDKPERIEREILKQKSINSRFLNVRIKEDEENERENKELEAKNMKKLKAKGELTNVGNKSNAQIAREIRKALIEKHECISAVYPTVKREDEKDIFELKIVIDKYGKSGEVDEICLDIWETLGNLDFVDSERLENVEPEKIK